MHDPCGTLELIESPGDAKGAYHALIEIICAYWEDNYLVEAGNDAWRNARNQHARLVRDIFGNPFRPVPLNPAWRTPTVTAVATAAYEERHLPAGTLAPERLAVLADALEDVGCDSADILSHLRGSGPHVRGCWVVDLLLGKE